MREFQDFIMASVVKRSLLTVFLQAAEQYSRMKNIFSHPVILYKVTNCDRLCKARTRQSFKIIQGVCDFQKVEFEIIDRIVTM